MSAGGEGNDIRSARGGCGHEINVLRPVAPPALANVIGLIPESHRVSDIPVRREQANLLPGLAKLKIGVEVGAVRGVWPVSLSAHTRRKPRAGIVVPAGTDQRGPPGANASKCIPGEVHRNIVGVVKLEPVVEVAVGGSATKDVFAAIHSLMNTGSGAAVLSLAAPGVVTKKLSRGPKTPSGK